MSEPANGNDAVDVLARLREERDTAVAERDDLQRQLINLHRERWVTQLAREVGFHEPADAWLYLKDADLSEHEWDAEGALLRALRGILREKPYLARSSGKRTPRR